MLRPLRIPTAMLVVAILIVAAGLAVFRLPLQGAGPEASAHLIDEGADTVNDFHASLDVDPWNGTGPCNPVDTTVDLGAGGYDVAVCIESAPASVTTFEFSLPYDAGFTSCLDVSCPSGDCLDDNPDANAGSSLGSGTPTSPDLGSGWDCNLVDSMEPSWEPTCHRNGEATAWMACWSMTGPFTAPTGDVGFPLAIVTFMPVVEGTDNPSLSGVVLGEAYGTEMGSCNPVENVSITCFGGSIHFCQGDVDCDGVLDASDNCPATYNPGQENSDGPCRPNGSLVPGDCAANPADDPLGDACDPDADNDALLNESENEASCPYMVDRDSDDDGPLDGYEVAAGKDPCNKAIRPYGCVSPLDSDSDGFTDCVESAGYSTCAFADDTFPTFTECADPVDSDGDDCPDWVEIVDLNGNLVADVSDVMLTAKRALLMFPPSDSDPVFDIDRNGTINVTDAYRAALNSSLVKGNAYCLDGE